MKFPFSDLSYKQLSWILGFTVAGAFVFIVLFFFFIVIAAFGI